MSDGNKELNPPLAVFYGQNLLNKCINMIIEDIPFNQVAISSAAHQEHGDVDDTQIDLEKYGNCKRHS